MATIIKRQERQEIAPPKDELDTFITDQLGRMKKALNEHAPERRVRARWTRIRKGTEGRKEDNNRPWAYSSDLGLRESEKIIRLKNAEGISTIAQAPRLTRFIHPSGAGDRMENYFEYLLRGGSAGDWDGVCADEYDSLHEQGKLITKQVWEVQTEPYTDTCDRKEIEMLLVQAAIQAATNPVTGAVDYSKLGKASTPRDIIKTLPRELQQKIVAAWRGWPFGFSRDEDADSVYEKRISSILKQLEGDDEIIEFIADREIRNGFKVVVCELDMVAWWPKHSKNIQEAEGVGHMFRFSQRELLDKAVENGGPYKNIPEILDYLTGQKDGTGSIEAPIMPEEAEMKISREGYEDVLTPSSVKDFINIWEIHCYAPRRWIRRMKDQTLQDGDTMVRAILTLCPDVPRDIGVLRLIEYPYRFKTSKARWCFESARYNRGKGDFDSGEGIPRLIEPWELAYNTDINAARDRNTICLSPPILKRADCGIRDSQLRQWPQILTVDTPQGGSLDDIIKMVNYPNLSGIQTDAQQLKSSMMEIIGVSNPQALSDYAAPPTAEQVRVNESPPSALTQFELLGYHQFKARQLRQLYDLVWENKFEPMPPDYREVFADMDKKGSPSYVSREDFKDDFIVLSGVDAMRDNPTLAAQKRFAFAQWLKANPDLAPYYSNSELVNVLANDFLGFIIATRVLTPMNEMQKKQADFEALKQAAMQIVQQQAQQYKRQNRQAKSLANSEPVAQGPAQAGMGGPEGVPGVNTGGMMQQ